MRTFERLARTCLFVYKLKLKLSVCSISRCNINLTEFYLIFAVILVISSVATAAGAWGLITDNQHVSFFVSKSVKIND